MKQEELHMGDILSVLKDDPMFRGGEEFDANLDAFNHEAYAKAIFKIVSENAPPLSIGLFGPWGIGKSTVVNILFQLIREQQPQKLKPVYFNAWKYSGDSFRRQFLIEVAKQVYEGQPEKEGNVHRLEQLNYTEVLREHEKKSLLTQLKEIFSLEVRFREAGLARLILAVAVLFVGGVLALLDHSAYPLLASIIPAALLFLLKLKFEDVFIVKENPAYDPKLIFPEQFEAEFRKLVAPSGPLGATRAVIAIDDIDRCEPATIRDILISIKTFIGQENCFFVVPCDEKSIVQVFQDPNQKKGYSDELLRKYFNVGVRMVPLMGTDLVDLATNISRETKIPQSVVQIAILANYRDARKMKHFLNSFAVKLAIAKARHESGFLPMDVDKNLAGFAKAVLIEDLYPEVFAKTVEHPEAYEALERVALGRSDKSELKRFGLESVLTDNPDLAEILSKTRDVTIEHIEVFLSLKTTNPEARIPRGFELKNSIVQGDEETTTEIIKGITTDEARANLAQLLRDLLNGTATFLKNTISATLQLYSQGEMFSAADKPVIAHDVSYSLVYKEDQKALQQRAPYALRCAKDVSSAFLSDLVKKYETELSQLEQPVDNLVETANSLYQFTTNIGALSTVLNKKFDQWSSAEKALVALEQLQLPTGIDEHERVPALPLLHKIASAVSIENAESAVATNRLRRQVLFKYWDGTVSPILGERLVQMLQQGQSDTGYTSRIAFVVDCLVEQPECIEPKNGPQLWSLIQQLFSRLTDPPAKFSVHEAVLIFAIAPPDASIRQSASSFARQSWQVFDDAQLRKVLAFLDGLIEGASRDDLKKSLLEQELSTAQNEMRNPSERTKQRLNLCFEQRQLLGTGSIDTFLVKTLEMQDSAFNIWKSVVVDFTGKLGEGFAHRIAEQCLALLVGSHSQPRRQAFFELFTAVLSNVATQAKPPLLQSYFGLCKHADATTRNSAATVLGSVRKLVDEHDFKLRLNKLVRDLCDVAPAEILNYRPSLDSTLEHSVLFDDNSWRDLAALSKRLIQESDGALQTYGISLVSKIPKLPSEHEGDLIHLLVNTAKGTSTSQKEGAMKLLKDLSQSELSKDSRDIVQQFLKEIQA